MNRFFIIAMFRSKKQIYSEIVIHKFRNSFLSYVKLSTKMLVQKAIPRIFLPKMQINCLAYNWIKAVYIVKIKKIITMAEVKIKPLADRVLVKAAEAETTTSSGIIIPDSAKEKPQRGTVIAAGPGKKDEPMAVKVGDTVLYGKYSGTELQLDGVEYLIMRESDIYAIL